MKNILHETKGKVSFGRMEQGVIVTRYSAIGKPEQRVDAIDKVTGQAQYADDIKLTGMLYGKVKRSEVPHAKILRVDTSKAEKIPGVRAVITGEEFSLDYDDALWGNPLRDQPTLALDRVRYAGEPVAAVAATTEEAAQSAVDLIDVDYKLLPSLLNLEDSMHDNAPVIHESLLDYTRSSKLHPIKGTNICDHIELINGDVEQGFREADFVFEDTFTAQMAHHVPLECRVAIVQFNADESIVVWTSDQAPYGARSLLANALKVPESQIRIIVPPYIGGGFGGKLRLTGLMCCVALAWKARYRPVKLVLTREEEFISTTTRHSSVVTLKTGIKKDGTIISRHAKIVYDTGAYADRGPTVLDKACLAAVGPYKIPHVMVEGDLVYTNKPPAGAFRGYGIPQVCWAHESQMDIMADKLGIDPLTIRLRNIVEEGYVSSTEKTEHHAVGLGECLRKVGEDIAQKGGETKRVSGGGVKKGSGIACGYKISRTPSGANASMKLSRDGGLDILVSSVELGQGVNTILSQIASEILGIPLNNIRVVAADTCTTPFFPASTSSRTTFFMGNAVKQAAEDIREQLFAIAENILDTDRENLVLENGTFFDKENAERTLEAGKIIELAYAGGVNILGHGSYYHYKPGHVPAHAKVSTPPSLCWMYGAHGVTLEIDTGTGQIHVLRVVAAHDVGKAINPVTCEGQIEGGVVQGMGTTLFEEMLVGEAGDILNASLADYKIPVAMDIPEITPIVVEEAHREGPYGAKGVGEMTTVPIAPAIANAIYDAIGVRIKDLPINQERILKALKEKGNRKRKGVISS
ncbi:MAG: xanthine dehydrogenase family protein molybdopterin-binding subunit [Thermodesulfobacteriota bacterium]